MTESKGGKENERENHFTVDARSKECPCFYGFHLKRESDIDQLCLVKPA
jgi:hypothetical protein